MRILILKSVAGMGDYVSGSPRLFSLLAGDLAYVEDSQALRWIEGGIAQAAPVVPAATPESMMFAPAQNAMRPSAARPTRPRNRR